MQSFGIEVNIAAHITQTTIVMADLDTDSKCDMHMLLW